MEKVGIYVRVSTEKQVKEGYSISAQIHNLTKYAMKEDWYIYDIYKDEGKSAKNMEGRPEVLRLLEDIKQKRINKLLLYKFDRLTRNAVDVEEIIQLVSLYPIEIITYSGGAMDVKSATGRLMVRMNGAFAQYERETTIERIKVALMEKVKSGYALCNCYTSYGYTRKKGQKVQQINEKEAKIVKKIFFLFLHGVDPIEIAQYLNLEKIPTKAKGKTRKIANKSITNKGIWYAKTIKEILKNPTYIGKVRYSCNEKSHYFEAQGKHQAIIPEKTFYEAQKKLNFITKIYKTKRPKDQFYCLGKLYCYCHTKMTTKTMIKHLKKGDTTYHYYFCPSCKKSISILKIEKEIATVYQEKIKPNQALIKWNNQVKTEYQKKQKEVMNSYLQNKISLEEMNHLLNHIKAKEEDKNLFSNQEKKNFQELTNKEKREYLFTYIEKIIWYPDKIVIMKKNQG